MEPNISEQEVTRLIQTTLIETVISIVTKIDEFEAQGQNQNDSSLIIDIIDETQKFVIFLKYSSDYLTYKASLPRVREEILQLKLHLLSLMRVLSNHEKKADHVAVFDLITEELRDNLTVWKIRIIPLLRPHPSVQVFGSTPL